jgi:hypothetical protein
MIILLFMADLHLNFRMNGLGVRDDPKNNRISPILCLRFTPSMMMGVARGDNVLVAYFPELRCSLALFSLLCSTGSVLWACGWLRSQLGSLGSAKNLASGRQAGPRTSYKRF